MIESTCSFDDMHLEKLRRAARESSSSGLEGDMFYFDPKCIDWEEYFLKTHLPGFIKHVMKWNEMNIPGEVLKIPGEV